MSCHFIRNTNTKASGGASIFLSSDIYLKELPLNTNLEAVAVCAWCPKKVTICNVYIPPRYNLTDSELRDLMKQLPTPFIIVGDFNGHNTI